MSSRSLRNSMNKENTCKKKIIRMLNVWRLELFLLLRLSDVCIGPTRRHIQYLPGSLIYRIKDGGVWGGAICDTLCAQLSACIYITVSSMTQTPQTQITISFSVTG